jgi:GNAT superfamily N-acetyltransferase
MDLSAVRISPLTSKDSLRRFTCGEQEIDSWACNKAAKWCGQNRTKVFTAHSEKQSAAWGFYSLSCATEDGNKLTSQQDRSIWTSTVPLVYLGYLAVSKPLQNNGLGKLLLIDALRRAHHVSTHVAFYGVGLRSLNDRTTKLYEKYGFGIARNEDHHPLMILPIWSLDDLFGK